MEQTNDGFAVAMADLRIRGSGQFLGQRQHGLNEFKLAEAVRDREIAHRSRLAAGEVLESLGQPQWAYVKAVIEEKIANLKS